MALSTLREQYAKFVVWLETEHPNDRVPSYGEWLIASEND